MHAYPTAHRAKAKWLFALLGSLSLLLLTPSLSSASESNPNQYACLGHLKAGTPEAGSEEQQVAYGFYCNGPITGYQLEAQIPLTGLAATPLVTSIATGKATTDVFSCSGEVPGYALNCVGLAKGGYETISGQFAIGSKLCAEPRVDALLTVTYAYLEKNAITQAISGPYDLGRPTGCKPDSLSGFDRLNPKPTKHSKKKHHAKKAAHRR